MQTNPAETPLGIHVGELYGKPDAAGHIAVLYHVLAIHKQGITLQNMDNPLSQFETTAEKLLQSGYLRLSQTPYVNLQHTGKRKKSASNKLTRCPYTTDIFAERADSERPQLST
ncbi:hypothetical protein [Methylophilus sp. 3sh_L]|uniref:hypothetical protein n=1 Tax=Methylophilus sp. 3sh_L TaxID=3377114 RepID=UPI00398E73B1